MLPFILLHSRYKRGSEIVTIDRSQALNATILSDMFFSSVIIGGLFKGHMFVEYPKSYRKIKGFSQMAIEMS